MPRIKKKKKYVVSWLANLSPTQVRRIRAMALTGLGPTALAKRYRVSQTAISLLLAGKTYRRVL